MKLIISFLLMLGCALLMGVAWMALLRGPEGDSLQGTTYYMVCSLLLLFAHVLGATSFLYYKKG